MTETKILPKIKIFYGSMDISDLIRYVHGKARYTCRQGVSPAKI